MVRQGISCAGAMVSALLLAGEKYHTNCHSYTTRPTSPAILPEVGLCVVIFTFLLSSVRQSAPVIRATKGVHLLFNHW
jgi:hypothetical protein